MNVTSVKFPPCPDVLTSTHREEYEREGFLAFEGALSAAEVDDARAALSAIVRDHAFDSSRGKWTPGDPTQGNQGGALLRSLSSRLLFQVESGYEPDPADVDELELKIRKFMWFEQDAPIFQRFTTSHPRTVGILPSLLGGPIELYQSMALIKPPRIGSEKPWHQDNAYFSVKELDGVIGTWIALDDVTVENGCMHVLPGGHRLGPMQHHHTFDCEIRADRFDRSLAVPIELKAGGILLFHANLPHQTPPNHSDSRRRAVQFHYRRTTNAVIPQSEYDTVFAEADGSPASCDAARRNGF